MKNGLTERHMRLLVVTALVLLTMAAYWQTFHHDFIGYDDEQYVTANMHVRSGLTMAGIKWAFTTNDASNWHPLTWISHMLDCQVFGMSPVGPHAVNLLLHIANTLLLLFLLTRMTRSLWKSAFVAALFALHPMHVESVAWVAERKDVLSTLFMLLTIRAYVRYIERPKAGLYLPIVLFLGLGLLAKPTLVTVPVLLLLLDYWPLGRLVSGKSKQSPSAVRLVVEKAPFFLMAAASSAATYWAQKTGGAVVTSTERLTPAIRIDNAMLSYATYITRLFWPHKMAIFYPHPTNTIPVWQIAASAGLLLCITVLALRLARKAPYLAAGWLWYLVTLVPMIGLIQVGKAAMADRYTYISYIGLFVMIAWGVSGSREGNVSPDDSSGAPTLPHSQTLPLAVVSMLVIVLLAAGTHHQVGYWKNEMSVFQHALDVTSKNDVANIHVGNALFMQDKTQEAIRHYQEALKFNPYSDRAHNNLGNALARLGNADAALNEYQTALKLRANPVAYFNMGVELAKLNRFDDAVAQYENALRVQSDYPDAHANLALILERQGRVDEAEAHLQQVVQLLPRSAEAHYQLGYLLSKHNDPDGAIMEYSRAISIKQDYPEAHYNLANSYARKGRVDEAIMEYNAAIKLRPKYADAHFNLGVALDARNDMPQAMKEYQCAIAAKPEHGEAHANLAVDLFISGKYADSWSEVRLARRYGIHPNPDFVKALSGKMPEPQ